MPNDIQKLIKGFREFRSKYFEQSPELFQQLNTTGQSPKTLVIGCSDSRADPALLTKAEPGEIFVMRNVANLVPPYETGGGRHGVSSTIEFAVKILEVQNVIVLGHEQCGGIRALLEGTYDKDESSFISSWMTIAKEAKLEVLQEIPNAPLKEQLHLCAKKAVLISMENLMTFPFIQEKMAAGKLKLYGWFFDLEGGRLLEFNLDQKKFIEI